MVTATALDGLAAAGGRWRDEIENVGGVASPERLIRLADCLDGPAPGDVVPPGWLQVATPLWPRTAELGDDGHPREAVGLPPFPGRRRLYAGASLTFPLPVQAGSPVLRTSRVTGARRVTTRGGDMLFVSLEHVYSVDGVAACIQSDELAYRGSAPSDPAPGPTEDRPGAPGGATAIRFPTDALTLFRFSVLTANSHRIHYDAEYAVGVEGLPGRLVHGPLLGLMMLEPARRHAGGRRVVEYRFRVRRPVVAGAVVEAIASPVGDSQWDVVLAADKVPSASATVVFAGDDGGPT
jgi:3-methylfumaryl-CoA hydratase